MTPVDAPSERSRFEELVADAVDGLPPWVHERLDNVEILVEEAPPPGQPNLLGLYEGIPLTQRGFSYSGVLPDRITIFKASIEAHTRTHEDLRRLVEETVIHEVAHYFGISDDRLLELGRE